MDEIEIMRDWSTIDRVGIGNLLTRRYYSWWASLFSGIIGGLAGVLLVVAMANFFGPHVFPRNAVNALPPIFLTIIIVRTLDARRKRRLMADMNKAPIRKANLSVFLSSKGVSDFGFADNGAIEWRFITDVVESKGVTLLLISPVEFIPLQDSGLPAGLTRTALLKQITKWRRAAA